jgi:hypothetical protein
MRGLGTALFIAPDPLLTSRHNTIHVQRALSGPTTGPSFRSPSRSTALHYHWGRPNQP